MLHCYMPLRLGLEVSLDDLEFLGNTSDHVGNVEVLGIIDVAVNTVIIEVVDGSSILTDEKNTIAVNLDNATTI